MRINPMGVHNLYSEVRHIKNATEGKSTSARLPSILQPNLSEPVPQDKLGTIVLMDDAKWEEMFPDKEQREKAQAALENFRLQSMNYKTTWTVDENGLCTQSVDGEGPIKSISYYVGEYNSQGFYNTNQLVGVNDLYQLKMPQEGKGINESVCI